MDPTKKRKLEENGVSAEIDPSLSILTPEDVRKIVDRIDKDKLINIVAAAAVRHLDVLEGVRALADSDVSQRKLFVRGLGWDTNTDGLRSLFSSYGEIEEAVVILDKQTGKSKGYGFVTFKHVDGALLALKEPSKRIDGRVTVTQLAAAGNSGNNANANAADVTMRKIYVWEVPHEMSPDKLLSHFSSYGEIEEGPLGFDRFTGKSKGFALFVYKTAEGAQAALSNPVKMIDGRQLNCKLANVDGKKGKQGGPPGQGGPDGAQGPISGTGNDGMGMGMGMGMTQGSIPGSQYGGPGSIGTYGAYTGAPPMGNHPLNSSSLGGPGLSAVNNQAPSSFGGTAGYGAGLGGPYGGYGGIGGTSGGLGGAAAVGGSSALYRLAPSSVGMPSGGYPESAHYGLSSSAGYPSQLLQPAGNSPVPRVPPGGGAMYPNVPPYF
ncbi:hypothetical protein F2P56_020762 [Juglans regia]|uniref:UBP1-associated protein 2C-like n=2 Tax=Juglans regia TaxID=51240 RepID=A0A2I4HIU3_JUGRE|nr:UBP1-associated protein 2C-like [Juglans regia]XP_018856081.1 UBP1-associated protein 2C-like [Juglans regia]XP_018856084.1 UBP1-associated protein 2C-like [Juglans regia]XP_018856085.1 UBP1-associated protein 2C-like [Juglans regia]XP_035549940.1 UBP1-associated protein 2C-like [Juglans regia]XP_035549941.1 UBP1-associated protein 2C-like [Juglans regia]KAF5460927.1 hypothetical protein F2P56_020761 [Juglans regia]KAF5460928.1 hypothetical protein F2P56_020763 [Juglans regia]KAF5460929.